MGINTVVVAGPGQDPPKPILLCVYDVVNRAEVRKRKTGNWGEERLSSG